MKINKNFIKMSVLSALLVGGVGATGVYASGLGYQNTLTDAQKAIVQKIHDLRVSGNFNEAQTLAKENNLPMIGFGREGKSGRMMGGQFGRGEGIKGVREAVEAGDYEAFKLAVAGTPKKEVTQENFNKMVEAHKLMESGDIEGAKKIMNEIGFGGQKEQGVHQRRGIGFKQNN